MRKREMVDDDENDMKDTSGPEKSGVRLPCLGSEACLIGFRGPRIGVSTRRIGTPTCRIGDGQLPRILNSLSPSFS